MKEDYQIAKKRLMLLYQTIKVRKIEESDTTTKEELKKEKEKLEQLPLKTIVGYLESSIDTIVSMKLNEIQHAKRDPLLDDDANAAREYETLLRKEEGTLRLNISVINQLKLTLENTVTECEDLARENSILREKIKKAKTNSKLSEDLLPGVTIYEEFLIMKKKLQKYEEQYLQSLKQENSLKLQLIEKNKEIQRLEIRTSNQFNGTPIYIKEKEIDKDNNSEMRKSTPLKAHSQCKLKVFTKDANNININSNNNTNSNNNGNIDLHYNKIFSQDIPFVLTKRKPNEDKPDKYPKFIEKIDQTLTRNKQNQNQPSCRSISSLKERSSNEISLLLRKNEQKTQRLQEATIRVLMNHEKRKSTSLKLIKKIQPKKKLILPITLHQKNKSDVPILSSIEAQKDISFNNMKSSMIHLPHKSLTKQNQNYQKNIINQCNTQDYY